MLSVGCSYLKTTQQVENDVKAQIQEAFDLKTNFKDYHFKIIDLKIIDESLNQYTGLATVEYQGQTHKMTVKIMRNGDELVWRIPAENFAFVKQIQLEKYQHDLDAKLNAITITENDRLSYVNPNLNAASSAENVAEIFAAETSSASEILEDGVNLSTALLNVEDRSLKSSEVAENLEQKNKVGMDVEHLESKNLYKAAIQEQVK